MTSTLDMSFTDMSLDSSPDKFEIKYCSLCDKYCHSKAILRLHMQQSNVHPRCETCNRSYLNNNSLRNHYTISSKHHYCRSCERSFKSASALRIHIEQSVLHSGDSDDEAEEDDGMPEGWEDELASRLDEEERRRHTEEPIAPTGEDSKAGKGMSNIQRRIAMMEFMTRRMRNRSSAVPTQAYSYNCPICLCYPTSVSATRCGHLFCTPCIERAVETSGVCPSCRKPAVMAQIRKVDLRIY